VAPPLRVGVQLHPQHGTFAEFRLGWQHLESLGADSIYVSDHLMPLYGDPQGQHYECWMTLSAIAATTSRARLGALVSPVSFRNPDLLADMAHALDHISSGRAILGIGAGWYEADYQEYRYEFGSAGERARLLEQGLERIGVRLEKLRPGPVHGHLPMLVAGTGERVLLRLVAEHADIWNMAADTPAHFRQKNLVLDHWCAEVGRDPAEIERTVLLNEEAQDDDFDEYAAEGATEIVVWASGPDWSPRRLERLIAWRDERARNPSAAQ
jgi:probable F420-dependent oxidoreductase